MAAAAKAVPCKTLLCDKKTRRGYCPKHVEGLKADEFAELVRPALEKLGATFLPSHLDDLNGEAIGWRLVITTRAGLLRLSYHRGDFSLYGRFDDEDAATKLLGYGKSNPYSGKWNHHYWGWDAPDAAAAVCISEIRRILP